MVRSRSRWREVFDRNYSTHSLKLYPRRSFLPAPARRLRSSHRRIPLPPQTGLFQKIRERPAPRMPSGLAVTPDGRYLVSLSFGERSVTVYDAQTLGLLQGPVSLPSHPHAVALSPDGRLAVIAGKFQVVGLKLPSLDRAFEAKPVAIDIPFTFSRHVLLDKEGENYYLSGDTENVVRMTSAGDMVAGFEAPGVEGIALSRDGEILRSHRVRAAADIPSYPQPRTGARDRVALRRCGDHSTGDP
ncbi:hypothetical protein BH18GEM1_BH18GEM1_01090 [soil metagenome]